MLYRFKIIFVRQFSLFSEQFRISPGKGGLLFSLFCRSVRQAAAVLICKSSIEHTVSAAVFLLLQSTVQILFPGRQTSSDMPLRLILIQNLAHLRRQARINLR